MYLDVHSHTQHSTSDTLVIRNQYPLTADTSEPFSVGIHPWFLNDFEAQWNALIPLAQHFNCWAIESLCRGNTTPQAHPLTTVMDIARLQKKPKSSTRAHRSRHCYFFWHSPTLFSSIARSL